MVRGISFFRFSSGFRVPLHRVQGSGILEMHGLRVEGFCSFLSLGSRVSGRHENDSNWMFLSGKP